MSRRPANPHPLYRRAVLLAGLSLAGAAIAIEPAARVADLATGSLIVDTSAGRCLGIHIYFADSPEQQSRGLMFVEAMDEFEGMLFRYETPRVINMWMRNTYIPLDMVFIREDQRIERIAYGTRPFSEERISSGRPVSAVLELNAGFAGRWQLRAGDRILLVEAD